MAATKEFHLPSLDGFRAVAALTVFVSHAGLGHVVPGGFGVTVFFFLSGYLITTLLRRELEQDGGINFRHFYLRRAYRILPPMYLVLFSLLILCLSGVISHNVTGGGLAAQILQVSNYYLLYADASGLVPFTGIFWSLAVEEHFYLLFPLLFIFCMRRWQRRSVAGIFLALCILVLAWRCVLVFLLDAEPARTYLASDTRMDSLLFGCIMGVWRNPALDAQVFFSSLWANVLLLICAVGLLIFAFVYRDEAFRETARYTVQGLALFPIFWLAVRHPDWPVFRVLNWRPVRTLGVISYVFYLSHLFWMYCGHLIFGASQFAAGLCGLMLTIVFSYVVHHAVELPFARLRRKLHQ
jgi:peptidoglycan/LPS O-acetylase OafA/YrhL